MITWLTRKQAETLDKMVEVATQEKRPVGRSDIEGHGISRVDKIFAKLEAIGMIKQASPDAYKGRLYWPLRTARGAQVKVEVTKSSQLDIEDGDLPYTSPAQQLVLRRICEVALTQGRPCVMKELASAGGAHRSWVVGELVKSGYLRKLVLPSSRTTVYWPIRTVGGESIHIEVST